MGRGRLRGGNKSDRGQEKARNGCLVAIAADNKNKIKDVNNVKNRRSGNDSQAVGLESSSTSDQNGPVYGACLASGVFAGIASGTMGGVFGLMKGFVMKEKELGRLASSWKQTKSMAKTFAVFSSVYTTAQCYFKKLNSGRDSPVTAAAAGCVTGVVVSYSGGAMASLQGCAGMALFSYLFEGKSASSAVLAVDRARAAMLSTSDLFFSTTVLLSLANHTSMRHLPQIKTANIDRMKRIKDQEEERELRRILETSAGQKCYEYYCQHVLNKKPHGRDWRKRNRCRRRVRQRSTGLSLESLERYYYLIDRHARRRAADKSRPAIVS